MKNSRKTSRYQQHIANEKRITAFVCLLVLLVMALCALTLLTCGLANTCAFT